MAGGGTAVWRRWASAPVLCLLAVAVVASFLPLIRYNSWWIRYTDFPRLQLLVVLVVLLAAYLLLRGRMGRLGWAVTVVAGLAIGSHVRTLYPYSAMGAHAAASVAECPAADAFKVMVANVQKSNQSADAFLRLVSEADPDILLVLETDRWWDTHLQPLGARFADKTQFIPPDDLAFGMHLFSKTRLRSADFRFFFGADTPTVFAEVELGGRTIQFIGLHPHPPLAWSQPTTLRDASLLEVALAARSSPAPTVIAGDFNAVPWESVTRRAVRIGGFLDPRVGRGFYSTFKANGVLVSWPLDQILFERAFALVDFDVLPAFGSDHLPVTATLCNAADPASMPAAADVNPADLHKAQISIEAAQALRP